MATTNKSEEKKMQYKRVSFDVNEIAPDAPAGEWQMSIPRGKCKVQPTKEDHYPMLIVPVRLDGTEEAGDEFQKSLGAELSVMIVFFDNAKPKAARMSKIRLQQLCEATDVDLDVVPKDIGDADDLEPLIRALEGKKFTGWTVLQIRKDTGETVTEVRFQNPSKILVNPGGDDENDDEPESERRGRPRPAAKSKKNGVTRR